MVQSISALESGLGGKCMMHENHVRLKNKITYWQKRKDEAISQRLKYRVVWIQHILHALKRRLILDNNNEQST